MAEFYEAPGILRISVSETYIWHLQLRLLYTCPAAQRKAMEERVRREVFPWLGTYLEDTFKDDPRELAKLIKANPYTLEILNERYGNSLCRFTQLEPVALHGPMSVEADKELVELLEGPRRRLH